MKIAVLGAGTMGHGIAQVCAQKGYPTLLYDINENTLNDARKAVTASLLKLVEKGKITHELNESTLTNLTFTNNFKHLQADLIIEAIVEKLEVKQELFLKLEELNSPTAIFASNTSSLSITQIASALMHSERMIGLHFFNPATIMPLVEVINAAASKQEYIDIALEFVKNLGKTSVTCSDAPGFIVNRVARPFYTESLLLAEEHVASIEQIDALVEATGFKLGPFKLMDLIGNDVNLAVTKSLYLACFQPARFRPSRIQQQKVDALHLGKKTNKGFYNY
jgi:3-hydroxybutyryl-CoA dehydrogenase